MPSYVAAHAQLSYHGNTNKPEHPRQYPARLWHCVTCLRVAKLLGTNGLLKDGLERNEMHLAHHNICMRAQYKVGDFARPGGCILNLNIMPCLSLISRAPVKRVCEMETLSLIRPSWINWHWCLSKGLNLHSHELRCMQTNIFAKIISVTRSVRFLKLQRMFTYRLTSEILTWRDDIFTARSRCQEKLVWHRFWRLFGMLIRCLGSWHKHKRDV